MAVTLLRRWIAPVLAAALALAACSAGDGDDAAAPSPRPPAGDEATTTTADATTTTVEPLALAGGADVDEVDDVYAVPDPLPPGEPGTVIQRQAMGPIAGVPGSMAWRVLYHSTSIAGDDIAVSGYVVRPPGEAPADGFPVLTWAHGTTGTADVCAPSRGDRPYAPDLEALLAAGYVVAGTDYQGLGTPGLHPYLVGESEGRGVLDAARAAADLDDVGGGSTVVVWGHSQGGHVALFAGEIAPDYAPELDVRGVVAIAPAGDLEIIGNAALTSPGIFAFGFLALGTWAQEYPELDLATIFTPAALDLLPVLDEVCTDDVFAALAGIGGAGVLPGVPGPDAPVVELFTRNSAGRRPLTGPILVTQGAADALVVPVLSELLLPQLCAAGADAELREYEGADHGTILGAASADMLAWTADRFAGAALPPEAC